MNPAARRRATSRSSCFAARPVAATPAGPRGASGPSCPPSGRKPRGGGGPEPLPGRWEGDNGREEGNREAAGLGHRARRREGKGRGLAARGDGSGRGERGRDRDRDWGAASRFRPRGTSLFWGARAAAAPPARPVAFRASGRIHVGKRGYSGNRSEKKKRALPLQRGAQVHLIPCHAFKLGGHLV